MKFISWLLSRKVFVFRCVLLGIAVLLGLVGRNFAETVFTYPLFWKVRTYHLLWGFIIFEMILVFIPGLKHFTGCGKIYEHNYIPIPHDPDKLKSYTRKYNIRALYSGLIWIALIGLFALLRNHRYWLVMIALLFYFFDQLFVNVWCPFKNWIVHNRCCATCRIYNWGFPIAVSPLIYIPSFWSWSLILVAIGMVVQWERLHYKHPERFSEISNQTLQCKNCNDKCRNYIRHRSSQKM